MTTESPEKQIFRLNLLTTNGTQVESKPLGRVPAGLLPVVDTVEFVNLHPVRQLLRPVDISQVTSGCEILFDWSQIEAAARLGWQIAQELAPYRGTRGLVNTLRGKHALVVHALDVPGFQPDTATR